MSDAAVITLIQLLEQLGVPYMIVGSLSRNLYTYPRSTNDADFVVELDTTALAALREALPPDLELDPQSSFETITATTRHVVRLRNAPFHIELFQLTDDEFDQARFARRAPLTVLGVSAFVPTPEDVIIQKLRWCQRGPRGKDRDDARAVLAGQVDRLDWKYLTDWCQRLGLAKLLEDMRREVTGH